MVLTQSSPGQIEPSLKRLGIPETSYLIRQVPPRDIPRYLRAADLAVSFIKPSYSKQASSPTKIAEYLASGLPVVCNAGVGDLDEIIEGDQVGSLVRGLDDGHYYRALSEVEELARDDGLASRCRASAARRFDLIKVGGERYCSLYARLGRVQTVVN
jgi:glycosyltransferase involved in cell wall biosynthesis